MPEYIVLVDENDNQIGSEEKVKCHLPSGILHRAFTALVFDQDGNLLLARRAKDKMLWPGYWDGTVASHPRESETFSSSAQRRMSEELGISCQMDYLAKFEYHVPYKDIGSENEICGSLIGTVDSNTTLDPVKTEIDQTRWISAADLMLNLEENSSIYCPWMLIALAILNQSNTDTLKKYGNVLSAWVDNKTRKALLDAAQVHLPDTEWRVLA